MQFTGERVIPGKVEPDLWNEHLSRYYFAQPLMAGRSVLDVGCGTGYGSSVLASSARSVLGLDISNEAITFAQEHYKKANVEFLVADCSRLSLKAQSIEGIVCFEVIEHLVDQEAFLGELQRVLKEDGLLVISTPNRVFYTEECKETNPFHTHEFDFLEFSSCLGNYFGKVEICYQNHVYSVVIGNPALRHSMLSRLNGNHERLESTSNFFVAVCSKTEANWPRVQDLVYLPSSGNLLRDKERRIGSLEARIRELDARVLGLQKEYEEQVALRDKRVLELQREYDALSREFEERSAWANRASQEVRDRDARLLKLQEEFGERTQWALRLNAELKECQERLEKIRQSQLYKLSKALRLVPRL
jgi:2-polyprenyl-3-methyl-5-hydroxy-6-metoxy-1,4-benzoquinol methylase